MYHSFGTRDILENVVLLSRRDADLRGPLSSQTLKAAFNRSLHRLQPHVPWMTELQTRFTNDPAITGPIIPVYRINTAINDLDQHNILTEDSPADFSEELAGMESTCRAAFEPCDELWKIFNLVINYVFCRPPAPGTSVYGASTSAAVGVIWATPLSRLARPDVAEFFLHELTHNLVHVDELCHGHYRDSTLLPDPANYAVSSILKRKRPMDKALHSLVVATELLLFRERYVGHPEKPGIHQPSHQLMISALDTAASINDLHARRNFVLTERTLQLTAQCQSILERMAGQRRMAV